MLSEQQEAALSEEISEKQGKLEKLRELKNGLKSKTEYSLESIGDIAIIMQGNVAAIICAINPSFLCFSVYGFFHPVLHLGYDNPHLGRVPIAIARR